MNTSRKAPNRILDLAELKLPKFARVVETLEELVERDPVSYLHPSKRWEYPWALERAQLQGSEAVLDAGCGFSIFPVYLASHGLKTAAVDVEAPRGLDRLHGLSIQYTEGNIAALPFADGSFDAVFCISVIEHLPQGLAAVALAELRRVLRPGGKLLLTTDYYRDARARLRYEGPGDSFEVDWNFFDERKLKQTLLQAQGLRLSGELDLQVDWDEVSSRMIEFHGYPYTSVGLTLVRT